MSHILLMGATGFIGRHLISVLLKEGHQITACSRNPAYLDDLYDCKLSTVSIDFSKAGSAQDWKAHLKGINVVINAAGIIAETASQRFDDIHTNAPTALFNACVEMGVKRVIQISALGANEHATSCYHQSKHVADNRLASLPLEWFIFRPSIIYGRGAKSMGLFRALSVSPIVPLVGSGKQLIQPVHIDDVVASSVISYAAFMQKQGTWLGNKTFKSIKKPMSLATKLSRAGKWIEEPSLNPETMYMLEQSKAYSMAALENHIQRPAKSFDAYLQENPATQAERWQSRLYLLRPLLRVIIAFVWLWTGLVSAFFFPQQQSYQLLGEVGISGVFLVLTLYAAALLDCTLGILILLGWRIRFLAWIQIATIAVYTVIISFSLAEFWIHPFGPVLKNLPLLALIYIWLILEEEKP